eukprot:5819560-Amphidinium_carterae.1
MCLKCQVISKDTLPKGGGPLKRASADDDDGVWQRKVFQKTEEDEKEAERRRQEQYKDRAEELPRLHPSLSLQSCVSQPSDCMRSDFAWCRSVGSDPALRPVRTTMSLTIMGKHQPISSALEPKIVDCLCPLA